MGTQPLDSALVALIDHESILGRLVGALRLLLGTRARLQIATITAVAVGEAEAKPLSRLAFDTQGPVSKVVAMLITSADALRSFDVASQSGLRQVLVSAVADGV